MTEGELYALHLELKGADAPARKARIQAFAKLHGRDESTVRKRLDKLKKMRPAQEAGPPSVNALLEAAVREVWAYKLTPDGPLPTHQALALALSDGKLSRPWPIASLNQAAA